MFRSGRAEYAHVALVTPPVANSPPTKIGSSPEAFEAAADPVTSTPATGPDQVHGRDAPGHVNTYVEFAAGPPREVEPPASSISFRTGSQISEPNTRPVGRTPPNVAVTLVQFPPAYVQVSDSVQFSDPQRPVPP